MFWGLILKHGKKYSQTVSKAFHLSAAALDTSSCKSGDIQVLLTSDTNVYILCTLNKDTDKQRQLDLNFAEGDKICFAIKGEGTVHLTGFLIPDADEFMDMSDEEEESVVESKKGNGEKAGKNKANKKEEKNPLLKLVSEEADSDSDEMDDTFDPAKADEEGDSDDESDEEEADGVAEGDSDDDEDDDDDEEESEEEDSDDDEPQEPAKKVQKGQDGQKVKQNGVENGKASSKEQKKDKQSPQGGAKTLTGGVQVLDLAPGSGPEAKPGKKVVVYYEGRLKSNNKVFDSTKKGNGFKFKLGGGEVIKGWDVGVAGMKVGGKRRITCPPHMAYGQKGSPPVIPGNSTLVFDVELKNVL